MVDKSGCGSHREEDGRRLMYSSSTASPPEGGEPGGIRCRFILPSRLAARFSKRPTAEGVSDKRARIFVALGVEVSALLGEIHRPPPLERHTMASTHEKINARTGNRFALCCLSIIPINCITPVFD